MPPTSKAQINEVSQSEHALFDPLKGSLCHELRRTTVAVINAMAREFADLNLKPSEASMLAYIGANPDCTQSDIARAHRNKATNLVPLIASLERDGLVVRAPGDGRAIALTLSKKGRTVFADVQVRFRRIEDRISRQLSKALRADVVEALQRVNHAACHYDDDQSHRA